MTVLTRKGKVYNLDTVNKKVLPRLLNLLDYIKESEQDYFSKEELLKVFEGWGFIQSPIFARIQPIQIAYTSLFIILSEGYTHVKDLIRFDFYIRLIFIFRN